MDNLIVAFDLKNVTSCDVPKSRDSYLGRKHNLVDKF